MSSAGLVSIGKGLQEEEAGGTGMPRALLDERDIRNEESSEECREEELLLELDLVEVKYWVDAAIAYYRACGEAVALAEFSNPVGRFVKSDMYIFAMDTVGRMVAHGANADCIGRDFYLMTDCEGNPFVKFIVDTANDQGYGWVEYRWFNPRTGRDEPKMTYFEKYNDVIVCCGLHI